MITAQNAASHENVERNELLPASCRHKGPTDKKFQVYLATTIRYLAIDHGRRREHEELEEEIYALDLGADLLRSSSATTSRKAWSAPFEILDIRWQAVLFGPE